MYVDDEDKEISHASHSFKFRQVNLIILLLSLYFYA